MSYIPLINELSELDKNRIKNYLNLYGSNIKEPLPPEEWLKYWEHSNQKLYKALGNTLIKAIPNFKIKKDENIIDKELSVLKDEFWPLFSDLLRVFEEVHLSPKNDDSSNFSIIIELRKILYKESLKQNKVNFLNKIKISLANGRVLQLDKNMKIAKIINKLFDACKDFYDKYDFSKENFLTSFEKFKNQYSIILNEQYFSGTLCFSIHPLDYLTMSDNSFRWSSCMSWTDDGCYKIGTIEMMNSNNVICAYIKSNTPYIFSEDQSDNKNYSWNNKKWRQLFYVTKDIIVNGKSYPFAFDDFTQSKILTILHDLVEENLNWHYEYGPESYMDMIHIHSKYRMDKNRIWMTTNNTFKHNILFDTQGMYNDILNDTGFSYLCFRNKVKQTKIISVSGKANCICCNQKALQKNYYNDYNDYNERYINCKYVLCQDCLNKIPQCEACMAIEPTADMIKLIKKDTGEVEYICRQCFLTYYDICSCCGKIYNRNESYYYERLYFAPNKNDYANKMISIRNNMIIPSEWSSNLNDNMLIRLKVCPKCINTIPYKEVKIVPYAFIGGFTKEEKEQKTKAYVKYHSRTVIKEVVNPSVIALIKEQADKNKESLNKVKEIQIDHFPAEIQKQYNEYNNQFI